MRDSAGPKVCLNCCLIPKSCPTLCDSHGLWRTRLLCPWNFPGQNTGVGCYFLLQGIFPHQGWNPHLLLHRWILYHWATWEAPQKIVANNLPRASYPLSIGKEFSNLAFNLWIYSTRSYSTDKQTGQRVMLHNWEPTANGQKSQDSDWAWIPPQYTGSAMNTIGEEADHHSTNRNTASSCLYQKAEVRLFRRPVSSALSFSSSLFCLSIKFCWNSREERGRVMLADKGCHCLLIRTDEGHPSAMSGCFFFNF